MTKDEDFKLLKIQTCVLRVNIHCDGCKQKVKKLLQRIEGAYQVKIDAEEQKVTVSGCVDSATLIKKLVRAGKHAELWSQKTTNQNQKQKASCIKDDKNNKGQKHDLIKGLEALKNQQKLPFNLEEDEDYLDDDGDEDYEEDELRFLQEKANQINLLRQHAAAAAMQGNNANNGFGAAMAAAAASNNGKMNNSAGKGNAAKKGNHPNQNMGMKGNPGGIDQKTMAALKMNNAQFVGGANINPGEGKMGNDINSMMNLTGFHGNGANNSAAALGGNSTTGSGGGVHHQVQPNNHGFMNSSAAGFPTGGMTTGHHPSAMMMNMNAGNHQQQQQHYNHPSLMNLQNRLAIQQPQMMYNRSPLIPTSTGYYYNYGPPIPPYAYMNSDPSYSNNGDHSATTHMFSDENTGSCSIM